MENLKKEIQKERLFSLATRYVSTMKSSGSRCYVDCGHWFIPQLATKLTRTHKLCRVKQEKPLAMAENE